MTFYFRFCSRRQIPIKAIMSTLQVTNVAKVGPFLLIYGHKDTNLLTNLNANIQLYLPRLIEMAPVIHQLDPNQVYLAHNPRSNKYFRCTVIEQRQSDRVTVEFIDYGNEFDVSVANVSLCMLSCPSICLFMFVRVRRHISNSHEFFVG